MPTIIILEHLMQEGFDRPYIVYALAERWRTQGHEILIHYGTGDPPPGDIAIVNIDLTVIPSAYVRLFDLYPRVINGATTDISKRGFSQLILERDSDWAGPVLIKTDAHFGGRIDRRLRQRAIDAGQAPDIPLSVTLKDYPILRSIAEVPPKVWDNHGLIVEKFIPEQDEHGYYMRVWVFFGDQERSFRFRANIPNIKSHHIQKREAVAVPQEIHNWRRRLGFDFGKFDYLMLHGEPMLIDTNRTPGTPPDYVSKPDVSAGMGIPSQGLDSFLNSN